MLTGELTGARRSRTRRWRSCWQSCKERATWALKIVLKLDGASPQVLPPLLAELRNEATQALVLPLVLAIIPAQDTPDFLDWTLPSLLPIATSAKVRALAAQSLLSCTPCCTAAPPLVTAAQAVWQTCK